VRHQDWKLVLARPERGEMPYMPGFVTAHLEAVGETQLFNLRTDPAESKNLATARPAVVKHLSGLANESRTTLGDHTGPGTEARFFDPGPRWPAAAGSSEDSARKPAAKAKGKSKQP
jgi:hypothetical protein